MPSPDAEARTLLAHVLDVEPSRLVLVDEVSPYQELVFRELVARRCAGEPVQHVVGEAWFMGQRLVVGPGVFTPRPETEVMVDFALRMLAADPAVGESPVAVELCAGSGAIARAIAAALPRAQVHAVELSPDALVWARRNLQGTGIDLREGDMAHAFTDLDGTVDLVIANPPYIPLTSTVTDEVARTDPAMALWSGDDGLDATRVVADVAHRLLRPGGSVTSEHAEEQRSSAPRVFIERGGFEHVTDHDDLTGRPRFVSARRAASHTGEDPSHGRIEQ